MLKWALVDKKGIVSLMNSWEDARKLARRKHYTMVECKTFQPFIIVANGTHYEGKYFSTDYEAKKVLKGIARQNTGGKWSRFDKEYTKGSNIWMVEDTRKVRKRGIFG